MFKNTVIKKADIVLFVILIIIGFGLSFFSLYGSSSGQKVTVTVNGKLFGTYNLSDNQTVVISQNKHMNKITIKNRTVQMTYSDCKNQICVHTGEISRTSQSIVCLPNKVMIEITGKEKDYDAIAN